MNFDNFDDLTLDLNKLSMRPGIGPENLDETDMWLLDPVKTPSAIDPTGAKRIREEEENLEKWMKGAVDKVDFRTRSALSRRLDKKKRKADKEKRRNHRDSSLPRIEEMSGESTATGPLSDREQLRRPRGERHQMAARKAISEASFDSNDEEEDEEEEEEYFDAPSTPKKQPPLLAGSRNSATAQQSPRRTPRAAAGGGSAQTLPRNTGATGGSSGKTWKGTPSPSTTTLPRGAANKNRPPGRRLDFDAKEEETTLPDVPTAFRNLSDIQRRVNEQQRELEMEFMKKHGDRLSGGEKTTGGQGVTALATGEGTTTAAAQPRSRPNSASSSTSSVRSGGAGGAYHHAPQQPQQHPPHPYAPHPPPHGVHAVGASLATSRSVDFRHGGNGATSNDQFQSQSSLASSSRSNEGSLADLSGGGGSSSCDQFNAQLNSRLPLPRRPTIPGKTGIPLPAPKKTTRKTSAAGANATKNSTTTTQGGGTITKNIIAIGGGTTSSSNPSPPADPAPMNDEECF